MSEATPRITAPYLEQFSHQTVRILGKVRQLRGEQATIDAGGQISVFLNRVSHRYHPRKGKEQRQNESHLSEATTSSWRIAFGWMTWLKMYIYLNLLADSKPVSLRIGLTPPSQPRGRNHRQSAERPERAGDGEHGSGA